MKTALLKVCVGLVLLTACAPAPTTTSVAVLPTTRLTEAASALPTLTPTPLPTSTPTTAAAPTLAPTPAPVPQGEMIVVTSTSDGGPGTMRQALLDAQAGATIIFDSAVFPPSDPNTIFLTGELPAISQGHVTIDGSNAGVVLDGRNLSGRTALGLQLYSDGNTIRGLQIVNFAECGVVVGGQARYNTIGGDRNIGSGPIGQANLISGNNNGISIGDEGASLNIVTGNFIGTDSGGETAWSNDIGIVISAGANHNTIGPGNVIANNRGYGVTIIHPTSLHNAITQNSIHSNGEADIRLEDGGNSELTAPFIIDYDVDAGTIAGSACPNCTIEVFSRDADAGVTYEGQTTADSSGVFLFDRATHFTYPDIMATATDPDDNTSAFSAPTSRSSGSIAVQTGNYLPMIQLQPMKSHELDGGQLGDMYSLYPQAHPEHPGFEYPDAFAERINEKGLAWMRVSVDNFDWTEIEEGGAYSRYAVDPRQDQSIDALRDRDIDVLYSLVFWDEEIQVTEGYSRFRSEREIQAYLDYVRFIVNHFKGRVNYYALLNEPNIGQGTQQYVEPIDYVNLVRRTVPVIRQTDSEAEIIIGEVTPLIWPDSIKYLFGILESDVLPLVDGISWHAAGWASPEFKAEEYYRYQSLLHEIMDMATANGFTGRFWATEMHWRTSESPHASEYDRYSGEAAAKYLARGIVMHLGMGITPGLAENLEHVNKMPVIQNLCTLMAEVNPVELPVQIESEAPFMTNFNFSLSDGDLLIALWSDGIAVEDDSAMPATLTLPGLAAQEVVGIDVLHSFEQRMTANMENGNLVIPNLLVKDYPLILRITGASSP